MLAALDPPALPGAQDEKPAKQGARRPLAGVQGARCGLLPSRLAGARAPAARRHHGNLCPGSAVGSGLSRRRFRGVHRASAFPCRPSPGDPHHQSARAAVRRGAAAHQEPALAKAGVIPHAFGERAVLKLMYAALIRAAERWRGIRITEFERRQLRAIRDEIDKDFTARTAPLTSATVTAAPTRLSSKDRT